MEASINLVTQLKEDYLAYSVSVLVGRAIPSLTDGLKPSQRRVLTAMRWLNLVPDGKFMKSARVEGETMGKLHPHGGAYGVMVTLAAPWNNNLPLINGQGNWGSSVDGAAASRYTECKLSEFAFECLLADTDTWQTQPNYDGSLKEPLELNVKIPLVLLNGQEGIGVGFATKIPPHSLRDICDATCKGSVLTPSFPTGCDIVNDSGLTDYQRTGVGALRLRARCETSQEGTGKRVKQILTFTNLPAGTNPEKIGNQIKDGLDKETITAVTAVSDQSDLTGDRLTVTLKAGTDCELVLKQLYHHTDLEFKYSARLLVVDGTKPVELSPSELIARWKAWRLDRLGAKFKFELDSNETRLEVVRGYLKAIDKIDVVIKIIRASATSKEALIALVSNRSLKFTADQARAILEMRLRQLTHLNRDELLEEECNLKKRIEELNELITSEKSRTRYMLKEVKAIGVRYGEKRRSELIDVPQGLTVEKTASGHSGNSRPRFLKIDTKKGTVEQVKGPRGALILEKTDKLVTLTLDGTVRKIPANYKGPLGEGYSPVLLAKKEEEIKEKLFLLVFTLEGQLKAMTIAGEDLSKTTSKGKQILPEGATLKHFGEDSYEILWTSSRKKKVRLLPANVKPGKPGGKGVKVATLNEVRM